MNLSTEKMREYQRKRRADVKPVKLGDSVKLCKAEDVKLVKPCQECKNKDMANAILRAKVLMLEKELGLLKREQKPKLDEPRSPYRLGPGV